MARPTQPHSAAPHRASAVGNAASRLSEVVGDVVALGRGVALLHDAAPAATIGCIALSLVASVLPLVQVWLTKSVVDLLADAAVTRGPTVSELDWEHTSSSLGGVALVSALTVVLAAGIRPCQNVLAVVLQSRGAAEMDRRLMRTGERLVDLHRVERPAFQDEWRQIQNTYSVPGALLQTLQQGFGTAVTIVGLLILLGRLQPLIPVVLVVLSIPHLTVAQRVAQLRFDAMVKRSRPAREMVYCTKVVTDPAAAKEIRVFGLGDFFQERFRTRFEAGFAETTRVHVHELRLFTLFSTLYAGAVVGVLGYVASQVASGRLALGDLALYFAAVTQAESRLLFLSRAAGMLREAVLHLRALFSFLDGAKPAIALPPDEGRRAPQVLRVGVEFRGVCFKYPESPREVLQDVHMLWPAGKVTALVGTNGAGKSSLVKLLTRMYDPSQGEILWDGVPLHQYDLRSLRRRIAVVHQDFARFALTLQENIAAGLENERLHGRVEQAMQWAGADGVVARLPSGLETELTRQFPGGVELSGGEWQKVALARAFVREAALVVLDEPTAALDAEAEHELFLRFRDLVAGKAAVLISHRFSTVRMADHIVVLDEGRVVETGTHAELAAAAGGHYAGMYEMQAARYR
jgi:ATP-binding cassette, subfamily B, bacterial